MAELGIPPGGDPYPGKVKYLGNNQRALTPRELLEVLDKAGWPKAQQLTAAMVALAESGGKPFIYNTYKQGHFGLFQISKSAWPEFFEGGSDQWADPIANARKAYAIKQKQGWKAWEGYSNDNYRKHANEVAKAALDRDRQRPMGPGLLGDILENGLSATVGTAVDAVGDAASGVGDAVAGNLGLDVLADAWEAVTTPAFWMRVAYGVTGVVLVVGGLMLILRDSPAVKKARSTAESAAGMVPGGKAAMAVKGAGKK